jgi:hypothetical protein
MNISPVLAFVSTAKSTITTAVATVIRTSLSSVLSSALIITTGTRRRITIPQAAAARVSRLKNVPEKI